MPFKKGVLFALLNDPKAPYQSDEPTREFEVTHLVSIETNRAWTKLVAFIHSGAKVAVNPGLSRRYRYAGREYLLVFTDQVGRERARGIKRVLGGAYIEPAVG